jgi:hypothetical protein
MLLTNNGVLRAYPVRYDAKHDDLSLHIEVTTDSHTESDPAWIDGYVLIQTVIVNSVGPDNVVEDGEAVYLHNTTVGAIKVDGWSLRNNREQTQALSGTLPPKSRVKVLIDQNKMQFSNKGSTITLLDRNALKVDRVVQCEAGKEAGGISYLSLISVLQHCLGVKFSMEILIQIHCLM